MAADLVRQDVAVLAATTTPAARAAKAATGTIPIVFTTIADPVQIGFVASLNRPGGNVTGATMLGVEVGPKLVELLHGAVPSAGTMALLVNPANPNAETQSKSIEQAAVKLGVKLHVLNASTESDLDTVFAKLNQLGAGALIIAHDVFFNAQARQLGCLTLRNKLPAIYTLSEFAASGGLISYGASRADALASSRRLCRTDSEGREAFRASGHSANHVRIRDQSQNRQGAWRFCSLAAYRKCR